MTNITALRVLLLVNLLIVLVVAQQQQTEEKCLFDRCSCVFNYNDKTYDITCKGTSMPEGQPLRRNRDVEIKNINTFTIQDFNFTVTPQVLFDDLNINTLRFVNNSIGRFHRNTFHSVSSLKSLVIQEKNLQLMEAYTFGPLSEKLIELDLSNSQLGTLKLNALLDNLRLLKLIKILRLRDNELTSLNKELLASYKNLEILDVSSNQLKDFQPDIFAANKKLELINLASNALTNISQLFAALETVKNSLKELILTNNNIENLINFPELKKLEILYLSSNRIKKINDNTFNKLHGLTTLSLSSNSIDSIETESFNSLPSLKSLDLENNYIAKIPSISNLNNLTFLSLSNQNGKLTMINRNAFDRKKTPTSGLYLNLYNNNDLVFNNQAFCSDFHEESFIKKLGISFSSKLEKCMIKNQLYNENSPTHIDIQHFKNKTLEEVCDCYKYLKVDFNIVLTGACDTFTDTCERIHFKYYCPDSINEFVCERSKKRVLGDLDKLISSSGTVLVPNFRYFFSLLPLYLFYIFI